MSRRMRLNAHQPPKKREAARSLPYCLPRVIRGIMNITEEHPEVSEHYKRTPEDFRIFRKFQKVTEDFRKSPESPLSKFSNFINVVTEFQIKTSDYFPLLSSVPSFIFNRNSS